MARSVKALPSSQVGAAAGQRNAVRVATLGAQIADARYGTLQHTPAPIAWADLDNPQAYTRTPPRPVPGIAAGRTGGNAPVTPPAK